MSDALRYLCCGLIGAIITAFGLGAEYHLARLFHSAGAMVLVLIVPLLVLAIVEVRST